MLLLLLLVAGVTNTLAQNVKISPTSGKLVAALTEGSEVGFQNGWSSMWRHEQLPLTFSVSDEADLTTGGEIANPAGNINVYNNNLVVMGGIPKDLYCVLSLPKGYRITGYKLVLLNNLNGKTVNNGRIGYTGNGYGGYSRVTDCKLVMYETKGIHEGGPNYDINEGEYLARGKYTDNNSYQMGTADSDNSDTREYVIERESQNEDDMSNQLYFRVNRSKDTFFGFTIKSFEVWFTAEGTFDASVVPSGVGSAKSVVTSPFKTSKIDVGVLEPRTKEGQTFFAYSYENVDDLDGNIYIYQSDAVKDGVPQEDVATTKKIYPLNIDGKPAFAFGNGTYYVEPPVTLATSSGQSAPVGYRVVGALFNYLWGTETDPGSYDVDGFFISYTDNNDKKHYLNGMLQFVEEPYEWMLEGDYIKTNDGKKYLACYGEHDTRDLQLAKVRDYALRKNNDGYIYYQSRSTTYYLQWYNGTYYKTTQDFVDWSFINVDWYRWDGNNASITPKVVKSSNVYDESNYQRDNIGTWGNPRYVYSYGCYRSEYRCTGEEQVHTINYPAYIPGKYTLKVYDKTGNAIATGTDENGEEMSGEIEVKVAGDAGHTFDMGKCNNDAVKFEISGLEVGTQALVNVTLLLESLDPYINNMNIVCEDQPKELQMSQTFTASNFAVSGGSFEFYVPEKYRGQTMKLSFAELYSNYGDETYYENSESVHNGRYSFVTSEYFTNHKDLYVNYSPDAPDYTKKVITSTAGNIRFKFNNAEDLKNDTEDTTPKYLTEYPFTYDGYIGSADPDGSNKTGQYEACTAVAGDGTQPAGSFFVFTADEPRYNIAPGSTDINKVINPETGEETEETVNTPHAWQHRSYAFYRMDVKVTAKSFSPVLQWNPVYEKSCYQDKDGKDAEDSMWGLTLKTKDGNQDVKGYLTYDEIIDHIEGRDATYYTAEEATAYNAAHQGEEGFVPVNEGDEKEPAIAKALDDNNTNAPATMKQILYIDGSQILSMATTKEKGTPETEGEEAPVITHDVSELQSKIGENALIFLPLNNTAKADNVAYLTLSNTFRAGRHIKLTDKKPFYSPYNIRVDAANYASYTRDITDESSGMVKNNTVMLPFTLALKNGVHTNAEGTPGEGKEFTVNTMGTEQPTWKREKDGDYATAYFAKYEEETTEANKPYMIKVEENGFADQDKKQIFIASQTGSLVLATTTGTELEGDGSTGKYYTGESGVNASSDAENFVLTNKGSYSGMKFDRADADDSFANAEKVFYFSQDKYLDLRTLTAKKRYLYSYPFRAAYAYTSTAKSSTAKALRGFYISYDEPQGGTTGIEDATTEADLMVRAGNGCITLTATRAQAVAINAISGVSMNRVQLNAGETQVVNLPAGIYVVNNVKILVK